MRFTRTDVYFGTLARARVDHTIEKTFRSFLTPDLLILDDFGLQRLTTQQSTDLYELIIARHCKPSFVMTSNRAIDEWLGLFEDAVLDNSALDRPRCIGATKLSSMAPVIGNGSLRTEERRH